MTKRRRAPQRGGVSLVAAMNWWIPEGSLPAVQDAKEKLARMTAVGPTAEAFTFKTRFPPPFEVA